jgi:hypothetical protein
MLKSLSSERRYSQKPKYLEAKAQRQRKLSVGVNTDKQNSFLPLVQ